MKFIKKLVILVTIWCLAVMSIGTLALPADAFKDSYRVKADVEIHSIQYLHQSSNPTDEELIKHHNEIIKIANEYCTEEEVYELNNLFYKFLENRGESTLNVYSERAKEYIAGKPNFLMFFILVILVGGALLYSPIKNSIKELENR